MEIKNGKRKSGTNTFSHVEKRAGRRPTAHAFPVLRRSQIKKKGRNEL